MRIDDCGVTTLKTPKTQEGCGGLRRENPGAFPKARPIFQQPFSQKGLLPEFRATRLRRGIKKGPLWRFSAYFPVFKAKKGPRKICAKPWLPVIRA